MNKVKVSKEVAELFDKAKSASSILLFMWLVNEKSGLDSSSFMQKHNLTDEDLINAYKYGWEVEYEFQVGDIVYNNTIDRDHSKDIQKVIKTDKEKIFVGRLNSDDWITWFYKENLVLVCKAENREDLKQCENS